MNRWKQSLSRPLEHQKVSLRQPGHDREVEARALRISQNGLRSSPQPDPHGCFEIEDEPSSMLTRALRVMGFKREEVVGLPLRLASSTARAGGDAETKGSVAERDQEP